MVLTASTIRARRSRSLALSWRKFRLSRSPTQRNGKARCQENVEGNPLAHLVLSNGLEMLHWEPTSRLATSGAELRLVAAGVPAEERRSAATCPDMSCLWQSSRQRKTVRWSHFRAVSLMFHDSVRLLWSSYPTAPQAARTLPYKQPFSYFRVFSLRSAPVYQVDVQNRQYCPRLRGRKWRPAAPLLCSARVPDSKADPLTPVGEAVA
jgi:hypothetical protein